MLEHEITSLATAIHAATCRWLGLVAEYDAREGWAQWGCKSCGTVTAMHDGTCQAGADENPHIIGLDWIIFGGKSGSNWNDRPFDIEWGRKALEQCTAAGCAFFFKQVAGFRPTDAMIPPELLVRQWPKGH